MLAQFVLILRVTFMYNGWVFQIDSTEITWFISPGTEWNKRDDIQNSVVNEWFFDDIDSVD